MKKIKQVSETNLDLRQCYLVQEIPFDLANAVFMQWNGTESSDPNCPIEILTALKKHFDFAEFNGYIFDNAYWVYDWPWKSKTFAQRYQRTEDKTGAFLRTFGTVNLINAEKIKLSDLAQRVNALSLIWDNNIDSEPYLLY